MILKDIETFVVGLLFIVSPFCVWNTTTAEFNSGVHILRGQIHRMSLFTSGGLGLGLVSSRLGLGLGLKNLVLFTSLNRIESTARQRYCRVWSLLGPTYPHVSPGRCLTVSILLDQRRHAIYTERHSSCWVQFAKSSSSTVALVAVYRTVCWKTCCRAFCCRSSPVCCRSSSTSPTAPSFLTGPSQSLASNGVDLS